jgi:candicidin polyketide synthase FscB
VAPAGIWPPEGAEALPVTGLYERLGGMGYHYGPAFQGLRAAWRLGGDVFAEVALPEEVATDAELFRLHPALLDAALHAAGVGDLIRGPEGQPVLPFAWSGITLHAVGAPALRVRLSAAEQGGVSLVATDPAGAPVVSVESLAFRPVAIGYLAAAPATPPDALFAIEWVPLAPAAEPEPRRWAMAGTDPYGIAAGLAAAGADVDVHADLGAAVASGAPAPDAVVVAVAPDGENADPAAAARAVTRQVLGLLKDWLAAESPARLVLVTRGAVAAATGDDVPDTAAAAAAGLVRSAQSEHPGRFVLVDIDPADDPAAVLGAAVSSGEPELAVRAGTILGRRLALPRSAALLPVPGDGEPWRLDVTEPGTLDALALLPAPAAAVPPGPGQVRVAVRAAGMNFRDVLIALGMYPEAAAMGSEVAGVVTHVGPGVDGLNMGDRVMGLVSGGFGPFAIADQRLLAPVPAGWSYAKAAALPVAYATAWYSLTGLADARPGDRLLVHSAAGGVGMAAVAVARHLGLEVFGTASAGKHATLRAMGLDDAHIASSRDGAFEERFLAATGGEGVDIVLNSLTGELLDASLRLMPRGGRFVEMGRTDLRCCRDPGTAPGRDPSDGRRRGRHRTMRALGEVLSLVAEEPYRAAGPGTCAVP